MTQEYKSFSPEEFRLHNEKLQAEMEKQDIDMLMLSTPENIYYSTGYRSWYTSSLFRPVYCWLFLFYGIYPPLRE